MVWNFAALVTSLSLSLGFHNHFGDAFGPAIFSGASIAIDSATFQNPRLCSPNLSGEARALLSRQFRCSAGWLSRNRSGVEPSPLASQPIAVS